MHTIAALLTSVVALSTALENPHNFDPRLRPQKRSALPHEAYKRANSNHGDSLFYTNKTSKYYVNPTGIPDVNFNIGESYAGLLPISPNNFSNSSASANELYFWFFPSDNKNATAEITIWLNGGPGCSSLLGLLQENGPFLWQPGTYQPFANPYSWVNLTNMVWIDQPIGTGFSPAGKGAAQKLKNEVEIAQEFMGFWKNFMDTFDLHGRKVYITGESYAGQYIPYFAYEMLIQNNTEYFTVKGIQINDPSINEGAVMTYAPAVWMVNEFSNIFGLNASTMEYLNDMNVKCGFDSFMRKSLVYPPTGPLPSAPNVNNACDLWGWASAAAIYINPCFNIYHILDYCPFQWDVFGFPSLAPGPNTFFNRSDVQKAINAPPTNYVACGDPHLGIQMGDASVPSALGPLPKVIEMTNNVVIGGGQFDFLLLTNGTLVTIQNMTWNGKQGFQQKPQDIFYVPYHPGLSEVLHELLIQPPNSPPATNVAGAGQLGITHSERGLTFVSVDHSGHEIPEYVPGAAYRQLEFLLGRIPSLTYVSDFTTQSGNYTAPLNFSGTPY